MTPWSLYDGILDLHNGQYEVAYEGYCFTVNSREKAESLHTILRKVITNPANLLLLYDPITQTYYRDIIIANTTPKAISAATSIKNS